MKKQTWVIKLIVAVTASSGLTRTKNRNEALYQWRRKIVIEGIEMTRYVKGKAALRWFFPYDRSH